MRCSLASRSSTTMATRLSVADHFKFDVVAVVEIEAAAGIVVGVVEGFDPGGLDALFGGIEIIDHNGDRVRRS